MSLVFHLCCRQRLSCRSSAAWRWVATTALFLPAWWRTVTIATTTPCALLLGPLRRPDREPRGMWAPLPWPSWRPNAAAPNNACLHPCGSANREVNPSCISRTIWSFIVCSLLCYLVRCILFWQITFIMYQRLVWSSPYATWVSFYWINMLTY